MMNDERKSVSIADYWRDQNGDFHPNHGIQAYAADILIPELDKRAVEAGWSIRFLERHEPTLSLGLVPPQDESSKTITYYRVEGGLSESLRVEELTDDIIPWTYTITTVVQKRQLADSQFLGLDPVIVSEHQDGYSVFGAKDNSLDAERRAGILWAMSQVLYRQHHELRLGNPTLNQTPESTLLTKGKANGFFNQFRRP